MPNSIIPYLNSSAQWPNKPREPLPPFPDPTETQPSGPYASAWTHDAFNTDLPFKPPDKPDIDFYRGNFCGMRIPGLPYVPGCTEQDTSLFFSWFLYLYDQLYPGKGYIDYSLDKYQDEAGYTHIDFHRADWMGVVDGVPACSRQDALNLVSKCAGRGLKVIVNLAIDGNPTPEELTPWIKDLANAGMAIGCIAWQINQLLTYPDIFDYIDWVCDLIHSFGLKVACQWQLPSCAVWPSDKYKVYSRYDFANWTSGKIDHVLQQLDTESPLLDIRPKAGGIIGEQVDVLKTYVGNKQLLIAAEYDAQAEFNFPKSRLELYGDMKGRLLLSTEYQGLTIHGYLNGARNKNGVVV